MDNATFEELEPKLRARDDVFYQRWQESLSTLSDAPATLRGALPTPADARRVRNIQLACVPITPLALRDNATAISAHHVLIAEIDRVPVGFVLASLSEKHSPALRAGSGCCASGSAPGYRAATTLRGVPDRATSQHCSGHAIDQPCSSCDEREVGTAARVGDIEPRWPTRVGLEG